MILNTSRGGAVWSARVAHNHKVAGSNPAPATKVKTPTLRVGFLLENLCTYLYL